MEDHPSEHQTEIPKKLESMKSWLVVIVARMAIAMSILVLITASIALLHTYVNYLPSKPMVFTPRKLSNYKGQYQGRILVAVFGDVYDVTPGRRHYGHGGAYHGFAGRDASKSFITGDFVLDLDDDVQHFTPEECSELVRWRDFYRYHEEYKYKGKVSGRFYNASGEGTPLLYDTEMKAQQHRKLKKAEKLAEEMSIEQPCSVTWSRSQGGWVTCKEGHFPRKVKVPQRKKGEDAEVVLHERCACLEHDLVSDAMQLYDGCNAGSRSCQTSLPDEEL